MQNKFTFKCWSCHTDDILHQLSSCCALCFAICADEVTFDICLACIFVKSRIYIFCLSSLSSLEIFRSICGTLCCEGVLLDIGRNLWQCLVLQSQISSKFPLTKKYVFCVKLISLKNFTLSLNEALKAHYLCFLLLIQRSAVQQKSN